MGGILRAMPVAAAGGLAAPPAGAQALHGLPGLPERLAPRPLVEAQAQGGFTCARKLCRAMTSCAEACHKFLVCGMRRLDGDSPCPRT